VNYFGYEDDIMLEPSREWMDRDRAHPFLLSYLTVTAHHDWRLPDAIERQHFVDDPKLNDYLTRRSPHRGRPPPTKTRLLVTGRDPSPGRRPGGRTGPGSSGRCTVCASTTTPATRKAEIRSR
jgi:hypothetical protein